MDINDLHGYKVNGAAKSYSPPPVSRYGARNLLATIVDSTILNFFRMLGIIGYLRIKHEKSLEILSRAKPNDIRNIVLQTTIIQDALIAFLVSLIFSGAYYAVMFSSKKSATIGFMAAKIKLVSVKGERISFPLAGAHYVLSLISFIFLFFAITSFMKNGMNIHGIILGLIFILWRDCSIVTRKKQAFHDIICRVMTVRS